MREALNFVKDNWIEWFAPLVVIIAPLIIAYPTGTLVLLAQGDVLLPPTTVVRGLQASARIYHVVSGRDATMNLAVKYYKNILVKARWDLHLMDYHN